MIQEGVFLINVSLVPGREREVISVNIKPGSSALSPLLSHGGPLVRPHTDQRQQNSPDMATAAASINHPTAAQFAPSASASVRVVKTLALMLTLACRYPRLSLVTGDVIDCNMYSLNSLNEISFLKHHPCFQHVAEFKIATPKPIQTLSVCILKCDGT